MPRIYTRKSPAEKAESLRQSSARYREKCHRLGLCEACGAPRDVMAFVRCADCRGKAALRLRLLRQTEQERMRGNARAEVWRRKREGVLVKPTTCQDCGATGVAIQGHHYDYADRCGVTWLCRPCHMKRHRKS